MRLLITGAAGQLGNELRRQIELGSSALGPVPKMLKKATVYYVDLPDADLSDKTEAFALIRDHMPDVVINCAAYTNVDKCETDFDTAYAANALGPRNLAVACEAAGAKLIHVSTDYVFSGNGDVPRSEADLPAPQSAYGRTKLLGEEYVKDFCSKWFIIRTSWLYGRVGGNFVKTIARVAKQKGSLSVVNDQLGNPTNAEDLAYHILKLACTEEYGVYHCTGEGVCSWYDFACEIVRQAGIDAKVNPCTSEEYPSPTKRPEYSALDNTMLRLTVGNEMRQWQQALEAYFKENSLEDLIGG